MTAVFCLWRMDEINWWERDCKYLWEASLQDENVHDTLAHCGLLKFMQIPLMKSLCLLLQTLVRFWDIGEEAFLFHC